MKANRILLLICIIELLVIVALLTFNNQGDIESFSDEEKSEERATTSMYCIDAPNDKNYIKVKVELLGSKIRQKVFIMSGIDYAREGCFDETSDALTMENFVPLYLNDSTIAFKTRFHSLGVVKNPYQFAIKLLDGKDSVLSKYPKNKDYAEGKIPSLSATIQISDVLDIPKAYRNIQADSTILVQNF